jgi:hypothetical protein
MFVTGVGTGTRGGVTGWMNRCASTVILPPDGAAALVNSSSSQSRAAPIPRCGSSWDDSVFRVPNDTSFKIVRSMLRGSISRSIARRSPGGWWPSGAADAPAAPAPRTTGAPPIAAAPASACRRVKP